MKPHRPELSETIHRRARWQPLRVAVWILVIGLLAAGAVMAFGGETAFARPAGWAGLTLGLVLLATLGLTYLAWRSGRIEAQEMVRGLDREIATSNRLEAMEELSGSEAPLAEAQRRETTRFMESRTPSAIPKGILAGALLAGVLLAMELILALSWITLPAHKVVEIPELKSDQPTGEIAFIEPESEFKATAIQEVPLKAKSKSSHGLQQMELRVSVNGAEPKAFPVEEEALAQPGGHEFDLSLYLDEFDVQAHDLVSYHLTAELTDPAAGKHPGHQPVRVASPLQFVEIRPLREDTIDLGHFAGGGEGDPCLKLLLKLKVAQLGLAKMNFLLAHTQQPKDSPLWKDENQVVGDEQVLLATKAEEAMELFISEGKPAEMINLLAQVPDPMKEAGEKILETENVAAVPPQQLSLAKIIEIQKLFGKAMYTAEGGKPPPPGVKDPFNKNDDYKLKPREMTAAGQLEMMLQQQKELNEDMNEMAGMGTGSSSKDEPSQKPGKGNGKDQGKEAGEKSGEKKEQLAGKKPGEKSGDQSGQQSGQSQGNSPGQGMAGQGTSGQNGAPSREPGDEPGAKPGEDAMAGKDGEKPGGGGDEESMADKNGEKPGDQDGGSGEKGDMASMASAQKEIATNLKKLTDDIGFSPKVREQIERAKSAAWEANRQLDAKDPYAAREPGKRAERAIAEALAMIEAEGREAAAKALADAQRELNEAKGEGNEPGEGEGQEPGEGEGQQPGSSPGQMAGTQPGNQPGSTPGSGPGAVPTTTPGDDVAVPTNEPGNDMASQLAALRDELAKEAARQQSHGSEAAARELASLSNQLDEGLLRPDEKGSLPGPGEKDGKGPGKEASPEDDGGLAMAGPDGKGDELLWKPGEKFEDTEKGLTGPGQGEKPGIGGGMEDETRQAKLDPDGKIDLLIGEAVRGQAAMKGADLVLEATHEQLLGLLPYAEAAEKAAMGQGPVPAELTPENVGEVLLQVRGASQNVQALITTSSDLVKDIDETMANGAGGGGKGKGMHLERIRVLAKPIRDLITLIEEHLEDAEREEVIVVADPRRAPREYREAVSAYFEQLSRKKDTEPGEQPRR